MRRKKIPEKFQLRKKLAECLIKKGYSYFFLKVLLGYSLNNLEEAKLQFNSYLNRLYQNDDLRKKEVESMLQNCNLKS